MRALVVEDNESLRLLFRVLLQSLGFQPDEAPNGSVALQMIQEADYDFIISDIDMPVLNGIEFYQQLSTHSPHLCDRIVFTTGNTSNQMYSEFFKTVSCPVLFKPFFRDELADIMRSLMGENYEGKTLNQMKMRQSM